jgi:hypothetical protein
MFIAHSETKPIFIRKQIPWRFREQGDRPGFFSFFGYFSFFSFQKEKKKSNKEI